MPSLQEQLSKKEELLDIRGLKMVFHTYAGEVKALDGVDMNVRKGEVFGLVGESGCGKSVMALCISRLLPENAKILSGQIILKGDDLLKKSNEEMREVRMKRIAMVFQDPMTFLNPVLTVAEQVSEVYLLDPKRLSKEIAEKRIHELNEKLARMSEEEADYSRTKQDISKFQELLQSHGTLGRRELRKAAWERTVDVLRIVRLADPERIAKQYPHELSGGMRQRAMIAMALARNPDIFIADEITTALDVTVQAQILALLKDLRKEIQASILIITHDLGIVAEMCDRVAVMYAGNIVEVADVKEIFRNPLHPYTQGLLRAIPRIDKELETLDSIPGSVPDLIFPPTGCRFHPRCPYAFDACKQYKPPLIEAAPGHFVECFLYGGLPRE